MFLLGIKAQADAAVISNVAAIAERRLAQENAYAQKLIYDKQQADAAARAQREREKEEEAKRFRQEAAIV